MINFLWHKIIKNKWLMLCLILGNIILIGMVTVVPLFNAATSQRILQEDLLYIQQVENRFPAIAELTFRFHDVASEQRLSEYERTRNTIAPQIPRSLGINTHLELATYILSPMDMRPNVLREMPGFARLMRVIAPENFEDNFQLIRGRLPSDTLVGGQVMETVALLRVMDENNLLQDELLLVPGIFAPDGSQLFVRIVGIVEPFEGSEAIWSAIPFGLSPNTLIASDVLISSSFIAPSESNVDLFLSFTHVFETADLQALRISNYIETIEHHSLALNEVGSAWHFSTNFLSTIEGVEGRVAQLNVVIFVLQIPIYVMLALFIFMVTKQILTIDANDISVLKSRGAGRLQILSIYAGQGLFIAAISVPFGILLGVFLCRIIGSSSGFLDLVGRAPLEVRISWTVIAYALIGALISFIYLLLPVIKLSRVGIVESKRRKSRGAQKPIWRKYFLDVIVFAASIAVLYFFNLQRDEMMATLPEYRTFDPMLFAGSSLFIIGSALLLLRLYPVLVKLIFFIGKKYFSPSAYASMIKVSRSTGSEQFIMLFLVFTVSVGIFSAQAARTINYNNEHRIRYVGGADVTFSEPFSDNLIPDEVLMLTGWPQVETLVYTAPNVERFNAIENVTSFTRVLRRDATLRSGNITISGIMTLMGIDTDSFGSTAWFREDFTMVHVNYYLNALALHPDGVLLSSNHRELGIEIGDQVFVQITQQLGAPITAGLTVVGFVDYWPTYRPVRTTRLPTGEIAHEQLYLAVANLGFLQSVWGVRPFYIWMRTDGASHQPIVDFIENNDVALLSFHDTQRELVEILHDPIIQSTNGVLTIGFIMTMLLCFTGFLIYWILSIKSRQLQFGVFRAIGMSMKGVINILISEQLLITVSALIIGGVIGEVASRLFVPLLSLSYAAADQIIPLRVIIDPLDFVTIYSILAFMLLICLFVLIRYTLKLKVTQVLKLGEE